MTETATIFPIVARPTYRPRSMSRITMPAEQRKCLEQIALDIFADATNAGIPFQQALASIYLSGLQHGAQHGS